MLTQKGEEALRTGMMDGRRAKPEELLVLELHSRCPDAANIQELNIKAIQLADGDIEEALECIRNGEFEFERRNVH